MRRIWPVLICALFAALAGRAEAEICKTVTIVVGNSVGSGYDTYARLIAKHLPRHVSPESQGIVHNMPGAGGIRAAGFLQNTSDQCAIGLLQTDNVLPLFRQDAQKDIFDPKTLRPIGAIKDSNMLCVLSPALAGVSLTEFLSRKRVVGGTGGFSRLSYYNARLIEKFVDRQYGAPQFQYVMGYQTGSELLLAQERSEVDLTCTLHMSGLLARGVSESDAHKRILLEVGPQGRPAVKDIRKFVPAFHHWIVDAVTEEQLIGIPFFGGPSMSDAQWMFFRKAFESMAKDMLFVADLTALRLPTDLVSGAELDLHLAEAFATPHTKVDEIRSIIAK